MRIFLLLLISVTTCLAEDASWSWNQWRISGGAGLRLASGAATVCELGFNGLTVTKSEAIPGGIRTQGTLGDQALVGEITFAEGRVRCVWRVTRDGKPGRSEALISFAGGDLAGTTVLMDGEAVAIPRQFVAHEFRHASDLRFCEEVPGKRLRILMERCEFANLRDFRNAPGRGDLQIFAISDKNGELALSFDLTRSADESRSERFPGDRYAWLDDLHLQPPTGVNPVTNPSFEGGLDQWTWGVTEWRDPPGDPVWAVDGTTARTGTRSARYTVHAGWKPRMLCTSPLILRAGATYTVSFWAMTDKPGAAIDVLSHFSEWGKFPLIHRQALSGEWTRYTLPCVAVTPFAQFCFGDVWWREKEAQIDGARIWLDDIQIEEGSTATALAMPSVHCASSTGTREQVVFRDELKATPLQITLTNTTDRPATVAADVRIQDLERTTLVSAKFSAELPPWGAMTKPMDLGGLDRRGLLRVVMEISANGGPALTFYGRVALVERIDDAGRVRYAQHIDQPTVDEARWLQALGTSGSLGFPLPEDPAAMTALAARDWLHITSPNGAKNCPIDIFHKVPDEAGWTAYDAWIAKNVQGHPGTTWWKTFNEPNCGGYTWMPADYVRGVEIMRRHLKAQDPRAMVLTPDCYNASRNGQAWLDEFLTAGGSKLVDAVAIHSYRARPEDPDLDHDIQSLVKLKARHGLEQAPILFTEGEGQPPHTLPEIGMTPFGFYEWRLGLMGRDIGRSEITAAALMQRTWLACLKNADHVRFYLSWMPDSVSEQPRATLAAMNFALGRLRHARFAQELVLGDDTRCYVFEGPDRVQTAVVWSYNLAIDRGEKPPVEMVIPLQNGGWTVTDLMGNRIVPTTDAGGTRLAISGRPVFIGGAPGSSAALIAACEQATIGGAGLNAVTFSSRLAPGGTLALTATNRLAKPVTGELSATGGGTARTTTVTIAAKGSATIELPRPKADAGRIMETALSAAFAHGGAGPLQRAENLRWLQIHRLADAVTVDGDAAEWSGIAPLILGKDALMAWGVADTWKGESDLAARVRFAWRSDGLYGCIEVADDVDVNAQPMMDAWRQDSLQLYLDLNADGRDRPGLGYGSDDESIAIATSGGEAQLWRDYTPEWQIAFVKSGRITDGAVAIRRAAGVTTYEFRLPPAQVFPLKLEAGTTCGLGLLINDDDGAGMRRHALTLTPAGSEPHGRPELWPAAILVE